MPQTSKTSNRPPLQIEALEDRRMLAGEPWGAFPRLIGQDQAAVQYPAVNGAGVSVAVIDTGIDYNHPSLGGGFGPGRKVIAGYDFVDDDPNPMDTDGHGTGVAGVIAASSFVFQGATYQGVAPNVNLIALRTDPGTFGWSKLAPKLEAALQWVIAHRDQYNIVAVNMSIGVRSVDQPTIVSDELATLKQMGVVLVAASGNNANNPVGALDYTAADPNVLGIGAVNASDAISALTRRNETLDLLAPGENVPTLYYLPAENRHITLAASGTSFAAPFVAGAAALLKQLDPTMSADDVLSILQRTSASRFDSLSGLTFPRLNLDDAITLAMVERDDDYEGNDSRPAATPLVFANDSASIAGLKLLLGDADYFEFSLQSHADVTFGLNTGGGSPIPSADLLDGNGNVIRSLASSGALRLANGTYYVRVNAPSASLSGTYGISLGRVPDDSYNNHSLASAATINLLPAGDASGGSIDGAKLLGNLDDFWRFTLPATSDVALDVDSDGSFVPGGQLLSAGGAVVGSFNGSHSQRLSAGTYYVKIGSPLPLDGTYGLSIMATALAIPGKNGSSNAIAYSPDGTLHFAYFDTVTQNLKYASRGPAGEWSQTVVIDAAFNAGQFLSLAIDDQGRPGVAYYNASLGDLMYAHLAGGSWNLATVDSRFTTGYYPSLAYDPSGRPAISYYYKNGGDLRLASTDGGGQWTFTAIDTVGDVGRYSSLARNPATGRWAVAYEDSSHGDFKYAEQLAGGAWKSVTVDSSTQTGGGYTSLTFTPQNRPAFSYYDARNADLKFAAFDGSRWNVQTVAGKNTVGLYSNLLITPGGAFDILYFHKGLDRVMRATSSTGKSGTWSLTQVTASGGRILSRGVDADGAETLAFLDGSDLAVVDL